MLDDQSVTQTPTDYQAAAIAAASAAAEAPADAPAETADAAAPAEGETPAEGQAEGTDADAEQADAEKADADKDASGEGGKEKKLSAAFTALARREQKLRARREALQNESAKFAAERTAWEREVQSARALRQQLEAAREDPLKALEVLGLDYDTLTQRILTGGKPDTSAEVKALREELKALREEQVSREREREVMSQRAAAQAAEADARAQLATLSRSADTYPLVSRMDPDEAAAAAWQVMDDVYGRSGKILAYDDALSYVEEALTERLTRFGVAVPPKGGSARVNGAAKAAKPEADAAASRPKPRTLTNGMASVPSAPTRDMTVEELKAEAAKLLRYQ